MVVVCGAVGEGTDVGEDAVPTEEELVEPKSLLVFLGDHGDEGSSCVGEPKGSCRGRFTGGSDVSGSSSGSPVAKLLFRAEAGEGSEEVEGIEGE